ncbi:universal stress protein [Candidatus Cyanaurora vandensis]|uniref:universal stress protein n=1 Tax=Candidatus Cyanaurora vandensis TaxID=2714958 RepID=UPI00257FFAE0|nr:universal stress protein [Candidatus Cyanaurora vandensis]
MQDDGRPDPEELLRQLLQSTHGRHKIYLGYAPGSGKTYRMLKDAQALVRKGVDLVVGVIETHDRNETQQLLTGLEVIPLRSVNYQGTTLTELDLAAILERRPATVLIDELAHTNAPGSPNPKRYQDVEALLSAGISVISTMNIQHLTSVAPTAGMLIGRPVTELVPDSLLKSAAEVQLVDASPETILERLAQGKVYTMGQNTSNFFRKSTLVFLRELALRTVAEKVDASLIGLQSGTTGPVGVRERILVAISTNPASGRLIRRAARKAQLLDAEFYAVYVQSQAPTPAQETILAEFKQLTEQAAGTFVTLEGRDVARILTDFALRKNITQVIIGESLRSPWEELVRGSVVNRLLRATTDLDVLIVGTESTGSNPVSPPPVAERTCLIHGDERRKQGCGWHQIYLGAAPGVGKTYAMLTKAHELKAEGHDVVCGVIETHGRAETAALLTDLEVIPKQQTTYQGRVFTELDLNAVLARRPEIVLIDELAHTNIPGLRPATNRYQDVETLLSQGIHVISTMNIQHLESLNTLVERTTGVKVRETVPDLVLECADETILIDLPATELQERLREGKIYAPAKIEQALANFFRRDNLAALRELLLREVADDTTRKTVPTGTDALLVCFNLRPNAQQLIRRGARIAKRLTARFLVAHIRPATLLTPTQTQELQQLQQLAGELGAVYLERQTEDIAETIVAITQTEQITQLVLGESRRSLWEEALHGSVIEKILRRTRNLDTLIVGQRETHI